MAKKKRSRNSASDAVASVQTKFAESERFSDSEDEFYASRDKILLDDGPAAKRRRKLEEQEKALQPSDDEVLSYQSADESSDEASENGSQEEEEEQYWGASKSNYYDVDNIETEADALEEEAEARRLQQKQLKHMTDADFGFDDTTWMDEQTTTERGPVVEKLPEAKIPLNATKDERLKILHSRYPEFAPLVRDFQQLQTTWEELRSLGPSTKLHALSTYLGAIAMYLAIMASNTGENGDVNRITALPPTELREHDVIDNLMRGRQIWDTVKDEEVVVLHTKSKSQPQVSTAQPKTKVKQKPVQILVEEDEGERRTRKRKKRHAKTIAEEKPKKSRHTDLQTLISEAAHTSGSDMSSDFGDENPLTEEQAEEKAKKRKSLRFYSSQIAQKANRRGAASREAGGDDDVPHKERLRERQERLLREAEKRGQQKPTGQEQLGGEDDFSRSEGEDDAYYQSLVSQSKQKKAEKQAKAEAYAEAARQGGEVYEEEQVGPDGKRAITYAISKNKGLVPKRSKDVRNPRVKKRKKYDEKKKKLASIRQVYKGGEGRGGYGGELTGINTSVVKSIKL